MNLLEDVEHYVTKLLTELPSELYFHNLRHTEEVVKAVDIIGGKAGISKENQLVVTIAAWFHDSGFSKKYKGHEEISMELALEFLSERKSNPEFIAKVTSCIAATKMPQSPQNLLEQIICDADLFHLSQPNYWDKNQSLKNEIESFFQLELEITNWLTQNLVFLNSHTYFTRFGKEMLQDGKLEHVKENIELLEGVA
jgi:predicted metal-dependent HD superfamily phosphohydrolase